MSTNPRLHEKNWHNYAGNSIDVPAPVGYIDAITDYNQNLKSILNAGFDANELKSKLAAFVEERDNFVVFAEKYMDNETYRTHPEYSSGLNSSRPGSI